MAFSPPNCDFSPVLDIVCFSAVCRVADFSRNFIFTTLFIVFRIVSQDLTHHGAKN
jgi:hypothetical protein